MNRALALALAVPLLLGGCTTRLAGMEWSKPTATMQQATLDDIRCLRRAADLVRRGETWVGGLADLTALALEQRRRDATYLRCMTARGYQPAR